MTDAQLSTTSARTVIDFFSRKIPMLDQNDDWHHIHIRAYRLAAKPWPHWAMPRKQNGGLDRSPIRACQQLCRDGMTCALPF